MSAAMKRRAPSPSKAAAAAKQQKLNQLSSSLSVVSKVVEAQEDLPPMARAMLMDMLHGSLGAPCEERHSFQTRTVDMIATVLADVESGIKAQICTEEVKAGSADKEHEERQETLSAALRLLEENVKATFDMKAVLANSARDFRLANATAAKTAENAARCDEELQAAIEKKTLLNTLMHESVQPLCDGTLQEDEVSGRIASLVTLLGSRFDFEDSILQAAPNAFAVAPAARGQFDIVVLTQLNGRIAQCLAELDGLIANNNTVKAERLGAATNADLVSASSKERQKACAKAFIAANCTQEEQERTCNGAKKRLNDLGPEMKKVAKAIEQLQKKLTKFQDGPLSTFKALQTRTEIVPMSEEDAGEASSPTQAGKEQPSPSPDKATEFADASPSTEEQLATGA